MQAFSISPAQYRDASDLLDQCIGFVLESFAAAWNVTWTSSRAGRSTRSTHTVRT